MRATIPASARLLLLAMLLSLAAVVARDGFGLHPGWPWLWDNAYNLTEALAVAVCALRAVRSHGAERGAWSALSAGLLLFCAGDVYWTFALDDVQAPPYPSWADAGYIGIYPAAYVALVLLLRARAGRISATLWLDGLICGLAAAGVGAGLVLGVVADTHGPFATVATNLAYPLGDLTLLGFVVAIMLVMGRRAGRTWLLVAAGFAVFAAADTVYLYRTALGTYAEGTLLDVAWPLSYALLAFAAWAPRERLDARALRGYGMLAMPAAAALASLGLLVVDHYTPLNGVAFWLASGSLAVVVVRFALTFRENLAMLRVSEEEATTDALTGLGNRRALIGDLDRAARDGARAVPAVLALFDLDGFKAYNDAFGHPAGDALLARLGRTLVAAVGDAGTAYRMGGDEFCILVPAGDDDGCAVVERAAAALTESGPRFDVGCSYGSVRLDGADVDGVDALRLADQRMYANKRAGRRSTAESIHLVLMSVVREQDGALGDHVETVAGLAEEVGVVLGLDDAELAHLRQAAALHDIGKVAIPDAIIQAPRALTGEEWAYIRQHTVIGARIIGSVPEMVPVAQIVRSSHERWDGAGYPDGLAGEDIPLGARIVTVCDSFEAMVAARPYRAARPEHEALAELERCAGGQFDPAVVRAFAAVLAERSRSVTRAA